MLSAFLLIISVTQINTLPGDEAWKPPIGIPAPPFGIEENYRMYDDPNVRNPELTYQESTEGGYFTHYVDANNANATDSGNDFGSMATPRLTVPRNLPAGSVVEIHNNANANGWGEFNATGVGTSDRPIFIRGVGTPRVPFMLDLGYYGNAQYLIVEGISFWSGWFYHRDKNYSFETSYVCVRDCEFKGDETGGGLKFDGGTSSNNLSYAVLYNCTVHDNGPWNVDQENDKGGVSVKNHCRYIWILDCEMYHNSYNGVQVGDTLTGDNAPRYIYVARNTVHGNRQDGLWSKTAYDVIFSQNTCYSSLYGTGGLGLQYDPKRIWFLFNRSCNQTKGLCSGNGNVGGRTDIYIVGNLIHDCNYATLMNGLTWSEGGQTPFMLNTIYNCPVGVGEDYSPFSLNVFNNVFARYTSAIDVWDEYGTWNKCDMDYNLLDGSGNIQWDKTYDSLGAFIASTDEGDNCIEANPMFMDAPNGDFRLQEASPVNSMEESPQVQVVFDRFRELYGIDLREDIEGKERTLYEIIEPDTDDDVPSELFSIVLLRIRYNPGGGRGK